MVPGWERMILKFRTAKLKPDKRVNARKAAVELATVYLKHSTEQLAIDRDVPMRNGMLGAKAVTPPDDMSGEPEKMEL